MIPPFDLLNSLIQEDAGQRGLRTVPEDNLITACPTDLNAACTSLVETPNAAVAVVTGFYIPHALPPCGETDGPLGALFLARALVPLGIRVVLATDAFCVRALDAGLAAVGLRKVVPIVVLPTVQEAGEMTTTDYWQCFSERAGPVTHLIALERVGPAHTPESLREQPGNPPGTLDRFLRDVPPESHNRCHTMGGRDITDIMSPAHRLFEAAPRQTPPVRTIGIGDGGNEIGMGKIAWDVIRRNIPGGARIACRITVDHLIVCGVSNWGAYALAAGALLLSKKGDASLFGSSNKGDASLFDSERERELLELMVERGQLVDGVAGSPTATVDGLAWERYIAPLRALGEMVGS